MAVSIALVFLALTSNVGTQAPVHVPTKAVVQANVTARIVSGATIQWSARAQPGGQQWKAARITVEDGTLRPAQLVEFQ